MRSRMWILVVTLVMSLPNSNAEPFSTVKTWKFKLPHGSLRVDLRRFPNGASSLGLSPDGQVPAAPISEQVEPLRQVLAEMPDLGVDPRTLSYLGKRLYEEDVVRKLAYACVDSSEWRLSMSHRGKRKEELVIALLNQSGAYDKYNEIFEKYGIRAQVAEAEKVGLMRFSNVPARNSRDRADAHTLVPADAMLGMRFSRI